ncbi:Trihydroxynaphthalene reductase [Coemansia sp. RSA 1813]|nr:Trihydroxynaphthalene reductase [Coemansia sp. RSA 1646]KAJ1773624.1 Trihydroxynaphthalene reductase [Coemansia sp. RSA 1843]KAJ2092360.1 Trihydroxynaphthalene reductase [Coemansia sp. RSA 986]KAJ2217413.1 Trihydroxynaphthalene reductase [Coemansia sp. RSA 487]KAJ2572639.1 Trihydroxynaphthalene reductase [Coemansia sp. RSA 1813]
MPAKYEINVPATSANIGPGYDVMGLSLSLYLTVNVHIDTDTPTDKDAANYNVTIVYEGENSSGLSLDPRKNLITDTALYVLACNGSAQFPHPTTVRVNNRIPLGRGLGSSGAAVVAGVVLADVVGSLGLSQQRMLDYCLMIERHPDNVAAALVGGFIASYIVDEDGHVKKPVGRLSNAERMQREREEKARAANATVAIPPENISQSVRLGCSPKIKTVAIIPHFELATSKARAVLPKTYAPKDVVFNLQRLAILTTALGSETPDPWLIHGAMADKVHQQYRMHLIPGLPEILATLNPDNTPGLLGICLSGAGPTILALAVSDFDEIAAKIQAVFDKQPNGGIATEYKLLDIVSDGATCVQKN